MAIKRGFKPLITSVAFALFVIINAHSQNNSGMLQKFTLRPSTEILRDLYFLKQRELSGEEITQPLITIMPGSKLPISGFLIDFKDDKDQRGVVLEREGSTDVIFLELVWVTGVTIHDAGKIAPFLTDLTSDDVQATATRLEVKTRLKKESERLSQKIGPISFTLADEDLPSNSQQLYMTNFFITDIAMSLIEIAKTELGKSSIKNSVKNIMIKKGDSLNIKLDNGMLTISYDFKRSYSTNSGRNNLIDKIYNIL